MKYVFLFISIILLLSGIAFLIVRKVINNKYTAFVSSNSVFLRKYRELNNKYHFTFPKSFDQVHVYDNEHFFNDISELDYLTYLLNDYKSLVLKQIEIVKDNKALLERYKTDYSLLGDRGIYSCDIGKFKLDKLNKIEAKLIEKSKLKVPKMSYTIAITLERSDLGGNIFDSKYREFSESEIRSIIKRLNNKDGHFYRDRAIWDSLCRVERGKVSNKLRFRVYDRDGNRCRRCGSRYNLEVDHICPISRGGKSTLDNLQTLCHTCNTIKGNDIEY